MAEALPAGANVAVKSSVTIPTKRAWGKTMSFQVSIAATVAMALTLFTATAAHAQSTPISGTTNSTGTSGRMWGAAGFAGSAQDSSTMHSLDGSSAAQVNAARLGLLAGNGANTSITAIGSQSIISTTVIGDSNSTNINATQTSTNSGTVTNNGSIATR